ncbi:MAG: hypothetical protein OXC06_17220 [Acidimicrobiaceae bacterium]|nr:hypothetical protein [Acidimicrobiaceae bacterium]
MTGRSASRTVAGLLVAAMLAAACGGDDGEGAQPEPAPQQSAAVASAPDSEPDLAPEPAGPADDGESQAPVETDEAAQPESDETASAGPAAVDEEPVPAPAVVERTITIGVAYPDVSAFATLNKKFSIGDPEQQAAAVLDGWRRDGLLPVNGTDIELVFRKYSIINSSDKLGVCTGFAQDDDVFAVVSGRDFTVGAECLASRFDIPTIDLMGASPSVYDRAPRLFTIRPSEAEVLRAYVQWADGQGLFDGATVGIFWDTRSEEAVDAFKEAMAAAGHSIAAEVASDGEGIGSPQDQISVERFLAAGVDTAVLLVGTSSVTNFMHFAESQNYRPAYRSMEWASHIGDVAAGSLPQEQYDGTLAMTVSRVGEIAAGMPPNAETEACVSNYERFSGTDVARSSPETAEWAQILYTCDLMSVLLAGLQGAGDDLTRESLVASLESLEGFGLAAWGDLTFGPGDHSGVQQFRTVEWSAGCLCWTARTGMVDFSG